jgi:hypothetical protein
MARLARLVFPVYDMHYAPKRPTDTTDAPRHLRSIVSLLRAYHKPTRPFASLRREACSPTLQQPGALPHSLPLLSLLEGPPGPNRRSNRYQEIVMIAQAVNPNIKLVTFTIIILVDKLS